jgi:hypothetical protein
MEADGRERETHNQRTIENTNVQHFSGATWRLEKWKFWRKRKCIAEYIAENRLQNQIDGAAVAIKPKTPFSPKFRRVKRVVLFTNFRTEFCLRAASPKTETSENGTQKTEPEFRRELPG